jgi:hypothetical protein
MRDMNGSGFSEPLVCPGLTSVHDDEFKALRRGVEELRRPNEILW